MMLRSQKNVSRVLLIDEGDAVALRESLFRATKLIEARLAEIPQEVLTSDEGQNLVKDRAQLYALIGTLD